MLPINAVEAISVVIMMNVLWEFNADRRKDELGQKARTHRGFAKLMLKERPDFFRRDDSYAALRLRLAYRTDRSLPY